MANAPALRLNLADPELLPAVEKRLPCELSHRHVEAPAERKRDVVPALGLDVRHETGEPHRALLVAAPVLQRDRHALGAEGDHSGPLCRLIQALDWRHLAGPPHRSAAAQVSATITHSTPYRTTPLVSTLVHTAAHVVPPGVGFAALQPSCSRRAQAVSQDGVPVGGAGGGNGCGQPAIIEISNTPNTNAMKACSPRVNIRPPLRRSRARRQ